MGGSVVDSGVGVEVADSDGKDGEVIGCSSTPGGRPAGASQVGLAMSIETGEGVECVQLVVSIFFADR